MAERYGYDQLLVGERRVVTGSHGYLLVKWLGYPISRASSGKEKVKMSTIASAGLELESEPVGKCRYVTSTPSLVLVHAVRRLGTG